MFLSRFFREIFRCHGNFLFHWYASLSNKKVKDICIYIYIDENTDENQSSNHHSIYIYANKGQSLSNHKKKRRQRQQQLSQQPLPWRRPVVQVARCVYRKCFLSGCWELSLWRIWRFSQMNENIHHVNIYIYISLLDFSWRRTIEEDRWSGRIFLTLCASLFPLAHRYFAYTSDPFNTDGCKLPVYHHFT